MEFNELVHKIIAKWGVDTQVAKIQEEALELALALNQINCPTKDHDKMMENLYGELADMKIMMAQAEIIFNSDKINKIVKKKLKKFQEKYLKNE